MEGGGGGDIIRLKEEVEGTDLTECSQSYDMVQVLDLVGGISLSVCVLPVKRNMKKEMVKKKKKKSLKTTGGEGEKRRRWTKRQSKVNNGLL